VEFLLTLSWPHPLPFWKPTSKGRCAPCSQIVFQMHLDNESELQSCLVFCFVGFVFVFSLLFLIRNLEVVRTGDCSKR
jgi:hypothetical protein